MNLSLNRWQIRLVYCKSVYYGASRFNMEMQPQLVTSRKPALQKGKDTGFSLTTHLWKTAAVVVDQIRCSHLKKKRRLQTKNICQNTWTGLRQFAPSKYVLQHSMIRLPANFVKSYTSSLITVIAGIGATLVLNGIHQPTHFVWLLVLMAGGLIAFGLSVGTKYADLHRSKGRPRVAIMRR